MHVLRHAHEVSAYIATSPESEITRLVQQRLADLLADDDLTMEELVFFVLVEPGETRHQLEEALGTDLQTVDGSPLWEFVEEHPTCFSFVLVLSQDGFGAEVFIPKHVGADPDLLSLCQQYSVPVKEGIDP